MASGNTLCVLTARDGVPTATAGAAHTVLAGVSSPAEGIPALAFDSATDENADFIDVMPRNYAGGGLTLTLYWEANATSNSVVWGAAFRRFAEDGSDLDVLHSYQFNTTTSSALSNSGRFKYATITFTDGADMDSLAVGELFVLRITRDADNASDNMTGDAYLIAIEIKET